MKSPEIRNRFVDYFKKHNHTMVPSSSLIPEDDPTLLFANAGMNQFKNTFLGLEKRDYNRAVSVQKCVRAGGKHNDLENVGFTARHHTFFEMLGNFSFGDYFKKDAIHFAWELLTKDLQIPKEKLYVTVFQTDDEAADIWHKQEGIPKDRIFRLGEKDNFWRMGDTGPCGPCSEIFYDHGAHAGVESDPFKGIVAGEDRFVEIWNLVFMQFYESAPGVMQPLPKPSVDTGSGFERVTAALQGKLNNYDTDLFSAMIERAAKVSKKEHLLKEIERINREGIHAKVAPDVRQEIAALRVIADHTRSGSFLIADGALPSNEGRGYVLRRILRRAIRFSQMLTKDKSLILEMNEELEKVMKDFYPEISSQKNLVRSTLQDEERRFLETLEKGTALLNEEFKKSKSKNQKELGGDVVFKLYDTFGFPADLTRLIAEEQGFTIDEKKFDAEMGAAREKAKASWKGKSLGADEAHLITLAQKAMELQKATKFVGYDGTRSEGKILLISNGKEIVPQLNSGSEGFVILDQTPFYAEGGGQVGDHGLFMLGDSKAEVFDCTKKNDIFFHHVKVDKGTFKTGEKISTFVQEHPRARTAANHSATHLLHSALRKVLGTHVTQAGQMVDSQKIRFDFTHNKSLTAVEIQNIEDLVNLEVSKANPVDSNVMKHKEALAAGAIALFGEKYGDEVRVLKMGEFSTELCGGTHVQNTSQIRLFKIVSEAGVSAGVRRIEALTGDTAFYYLNHLAQEALTARRQNNLEAGWEKLVHEEFWQDLKKDNLKNSQLLPGFIETQKEAKKSLEKEIKKLQGSQVNVDQLLAGAKNFKSKSGSSKLVLADVALDDRDVLAQVTDQLKNKIQSGVVIVVGHGEGSHPVIISVSKDLNPEVSAGQLLKEVAGKMGGKGGGRPDFAQGAAPDRTQIKNAFETAEKILGTT